jgi:hypothetical protein
MKSALMAVAITALMGGLVIAPVTQQSAKAQVYGGLKSTSAPAGGAYAYGYGYGNCAWLRRQALITNSPYWWNRYYSCTY